MADVWRTVKLDDRVNAVVLRAAGDRAFCAGLDVKKSYGQPSNVWNHEDPGELLSPKWQKMWKPVVCAVQGMCTAGAFYFVNESDVVICSTDATFFDSHVSAGLVCALEPIGLMRRIGLGETLRIALTGNDERVSAQTALRIGLVTEVVDTDELWARAHDIATHDRRPPDVGDAGHREGDLGVAGQAVPRRARPGADLHPARQPARARPNSTPTVRGTHRGSGDDRHPLEPSASPTFWRCSPTAPAIEYEDRWSSWGQLADFAARIDELVVDAAGRPAGRRAAAQPPTARGHPPRRTDAPVPPSSSINPSRGDDRTRADITALDLPMVVGTPDDVAALVTPSSRTAIVTITELDETVVVTPAAARRSDAGRPGVAVRMLTSGTTGPPKRIDLTYDMLARSVIGADPATSPHHGAAARRRDRQRAAGAHRRRVPRAAVRRRGPPVRPVGALRTGPLGGGRPRAPPASGVAGARRAADGAALRPDPRRSGQHPGGHLGHRSAVRRRRRRVHREVRHPRADLLRRNRIRRRRGRLVLGGPPRVLGRQARQRRSGHPRRTAARRRRRRQRARPGPTRSAGGQAGPAGPGRRTGSAPPTWPASTPTGSCGSSAGPIRPSSAAASR